MKLKVCVGLAAIALILLSGTVQIVRGADNDWNMLIRTLRSNPQDSQDGRFLLELTPCYYRYKTDTKDRFYTGLFFSAEISREWEVSIGSEFLTYQSPDFGLADIYVGATRTFYKKNDYTIALAGYVLFPTGDKAFREPGMEPTLTLFLSRTLGDWEISLAVGTTYAADVQGEPNYLDLEMGVEMDYTLDDKNYFSFFSSGYTPDQRSDGVPRVLAGASYTRTLTQRQSMGVMLTKGLSGKGMDWSGTLIYSYTF